MKVTKPEKRFPSLSIKILSAPPPKKNHKNNPGMFTFHDSLIFFFFFFWRDICGLCMVSSVGIYNV